MLQQQHLKEAYWFGQPMLATDKCMSAYGGFRPVLQIVPSELSTIIWDKIKSQPTLIGPIRLQQRHPVFWTAATCLELSSALMLHLSCYYSSSSTRRSLSDEFFIAGDNGFLKLCKRFVVARAAKTVTKYQDSPIDTLFILFELLRDLANRYDK
jgi:hypothetical protein